VWTRSDIPGTGIDDWRSRRPTKGTHPAKGVLPTWHASDDYPVYTDRKDAARRRTEPSGLVIYNIRMYGRSVRQVCTAVWARLRGQGIAVRTTKTSKGILEARPVLRPGWRDPFVKSTCPYCGVPQTEHSNTRPTE